MKISLITLFAIAVLAGCSDGSSVSVAEQPNDMFGTLNLSVSDGPVQNASQVCIEFTEAEFKKAGAGNQVFTFDPAAKIDLLAYQGMNLAPLLTDAQLEVGDYQWVRLGVNAPRGGNGGDGAGMNDTECVGTGSYIVLEDGSVHGLFIPSGAESGLKLNRGFTLPVGGEANFVAEFDLMNSIRAPQGFDPEYLMRPTVKLMDLAETGSIAGEVSMELATTPDCEPAVFLFAAGDEPDDYEDDAPADTVDPIGSDIVEMKNDGRYVYEIGPVSAGSYNLAFSCDADDPDIDELLEFIAFTGNPVSVDINQQVIADF